MRGNRRVERALGSVEVLKDGIASGVSVDLLANNAIIIKGLQAEWPPCVKLEPNQRRISVSTDGIKWVDRSDAAELWLLRALDPRHLVRHAVIEKETVTETIAQAVGQVKMAKPSEVSKKETFAESLFFSHAVFGKSPISAWSIPVLIERKGKQILRIEEEFPPSKERLTLRLLQKRRP